MRRWMVRVLDYKAGFHKLTPRPFENSHVVELEPAGSVRCRRKKSWDWPIPHEIGQYFCSCDRSPFDVHDFAGDRGLFPSHSQFDDFFVATKMEEADSDRLVRGHFVKTEDPVVQKVDVVFTSWRD